MLEQSVFEFCRGRPERGWALFLGVLLDRNTVGRVAQFRTGVIDREKLRGSLIKPEMFHISLHGFRASGKLPSQLVSAVMEIGNAVSVSPFEVTFRYLLSFGKIQAANDEPRQSPLVLRGESEGLFGLHRALGAGLRTGGLPAAEFFTPHITLLYGSKPVELRVISPICFVVNEFVLIHSELGRKRYNVLRRWSLTG